MSRKRDNLKKKIKFLQKATKEAKQELAEMGKEPELRHGDYGIGENRIGIRYFRLVVNREVYNECGC